MKRVKIFLVLLFLIKYNNAQNLEMTFWKSADKDNFFKIYVNKRLIEINLLENNEISYFIQNYGFYDCCDVPRIDSLKEKGIYYFELDSIDFLDEEIRKTNTYYMCGEMIIKQSEKDILMIIYYSSRQIFYRYLKIESLPKNVEIFLEEKGIKIKK